jgi:hypothetical protein
VRDRRPGCPAEDLVYADDRAKRPQYGIAPGQGLSDVFTSCVRAKVLL